MHLIPTDEEVVAVLRETGALRDGHFEYPNGMHSNEYLQVPLAMRRSQNHRLLSVGLSRRLRANPGLSTIPIIKKESHCPIVIDPSQGAGRVAQVLEQGLQHGSGLCARVLLEHLPASDTGQIWNVTST